MTARHTLTHTAVPTLLNAMRRLHFTTRAKHDAEWRTTFAHLARINRTPHHERIRITWVHERPNRRSLPDTAACIYSAKAALDGLVDAGVIVDDGPDHVTAQTFTVAVTGRHALTCHIDPEEMP